MKIAIVGPPKSGKTLLVQRLAKQFDSAFVKEYASIFHHEFEETYLPTIAKKQIELEELAKCKSELLFCDTDVLSLCITSERNYGSVAKELEELKNIESYSMHLVTFFQGSDSAWYWKQFSHQLAEVDHPVWLLSGDPDVAYYQACKAIRSLGAAK